MKLHPVRITFQTLNLWLIFHNYIPRSLDANEMLQHPFVPTRANEMTS